MPTAVRITKSSPHLGDSCAACPHPFAPGDEVVACPRCARFHHAQCWRIDEDTCGIEGCEGQGPIGEGEAEVEDEIEETISAEPSSPPPPPDPQRRRRPTSRPAPAPSAQPTRPQRIPWHRSLAQSCLIIAVAIAILIIAFSCWGLWAITDYIMIDELGWFYR